MELVGQEDQNLIPKGKRTKCQKFQMLISPNPNFSEPNSKLVGQCHSFFNFSSSSSSDGRDVEDDDNKDEDEDVDEDDKDMANCLILLAQGSPSSSLGKFMGDLEDQNGKVKAAGRCVYECKTCSRTFPSFQALGGHRSSHKNKAIVAAAGQNPIASISPANEHQRKQFNNNNNISSPFDRLHLSRSDYYKNKFKLVNNNNKVHQCSICGAKFMSGQALGGHMRRHRRVYGEAFEDSGEIERRRLKKQRSNLLCLDLNLNLNLPAPEDDVKGRSGAGLMAAPPLLSCKPAITENIEHFYMWM